MSRKASLEVPKSTKTSKLSQKSRKSKKTFLLNKTQLSKASLKSKKSQKTDKNSHIEADLTQQPTTQVELQTFDYLQFKRMVKAYTNICRLNNITLSKQLFMKKMLKFVTEEFQKCQLEIQKGINSPKVIFLKCSALVELLTSGLKSINKFKWEANEISQ